MNSEDSAFDDPPDRLPQDPFSEPPSTQRIEQVKLRYELDWLDIDGVEGVGVGTNEIGDDSIIIYVSDPSITDNLPKQVERVPVQVVITDEFDALDR